MILKVKNNQTEFAPVSYLSASGTAGGTVSTVRNNNSFTNQWAAQFGETGNEKTELKMISAVGTAGTTITTSALRYDHPVDTPVYNLKYDKVIFKVSTTGTAGSAVPLTGGTVSITPDSAYTQFEDTNGSTTYAYKTQFYNSVTLSASSESDWITFSGYPMYSLAGMRNRVRSKIIASNFATDDELDGYLNEWLETMNSTVIDVNKDYAMGTVDITFTGTTKEMTIPVDDFVQPKRVWFSPGATFDQTQAHNAKYQEVNSFYPTESFNESLPQFYFSGDNIIGRNPAATTITAHINYYKLLTMLRNDTDNLPLSMRSFTNSFVCYALACVHYRNNDQIEGDKWEAKAYRDLDKFKRFITPRDKSSYQLIDIVESFGSESPDDIWY